MCIARVKILFSEDIFFIVGISQSFKEKKFYFSLENFVTFVNFSNSRLEEIVSP